MEEGMPLLETQSPNQIDVTILTWRLFGKEVKRLGVIAAPMVAVTVSQSLLQVVCMVMVGHLGELYLSSTAIAISLSAMSGFCLLMGMSTALETLCGQAYGAQQYQKLGTLTYTAIFSLLIVCLPLSVIWINMEKVLIFLGQDPLISREAGNFTMCLIPSLFAYAISQPIIRYLQMQSLVIPMLVITCVTLLIHVPLCWVLVFKSGLKNLGGAIAMSVSIWLNALMLVMYMKYSSTCSKTRVPVSMEVIRGVREFLSFAIPSATMICLEYWSYELLVLLSGILPNPELETSVLSICLSTIETLYGIPIGLAAAVSTRVSNELGAGNPQNARIAVLAVIFLATIETIVVSTTLYAIRHTFGYTFSNDKEAVYYVTEMAPLICLTIVLDSIQGVLSGVARGCGWQHIGAYVNLGAFYIFGIPIAVALAFWMQLKGKGLWIGIQIGAAIQSLLLAIITSLTNWEKHAHEARERLFEGTSI